MKARTKKGYEMQLAGLYLDFRILFPPLFEHEIQEIGFTRIRTSLEKKLGVIVSWVLSSYCCHFSRRRLLQKQTDPEHQYCSCRLPRCCCRFLLAVRSVHQKCHFPLPVGNDRWNSWFLAVRVSRSHKWFSATTRWSDRIPQEFGRRTCSKPWRSDGL